MKILYVIVAIIAIVGIYYFLFANKAEAGKSDMTATNPATPQLADVFTAPSVQKDLNIRDIPAQIGLDQLATTKDSGSKDAVRSLFSGDYASEDAIRALDSKINTVIQTLKGNPVTDGSGGQTVKVAQPDNVPTSGQNATVTNPDASGKGNLTLNKQLAISAQQLGTVINPKTGDVLVNVGSFAKKSGRTVITSPTGSQFVVIGGRAFNTRFALKQSTLEKLLKSETLGKNTK